MALHWPIPRSGKNRADSEKDIFERHVSHARRWAWLALLWEGLWPLLLPAVLIVSAFVTVSWFGLWALMPDWLRLVCVGGFGVAVVAGLWPLRKFRLPDTDALDARIEQTNRLAHRPISTQTENIAGGSNSGFSKALWQEHQKRMAARVGALAPDRPAPKIARYDPWALRAIFPLLLFVAFGMAHNDPWGRIMSAFVPQTKTALAAPRVDVWVSPPAYTNKPPLYLSQKTAAVGARKSDAVKPVAHSVPIGSELVVRVAGNRAMQLHYTAGESRIVVTAKEAEATDKTPSDQKTGPQEFRFNLQHTGTAELSDPNGQIRQWAFDIVPDTVPVIKFSSDPTRARNGALELAYEMSDDYGVVSARAEFKPLKAGAKHARPLVKAPDFALPLPRHRAVGGTAKTSRDLSNHPWAGGPINLTLIAVDAAKQEGRSETRKITLPSRVFRKPLALAIVDERRNLALDARQRRRVTRMIDAISNTAPEEFITSLSVYTGLRVAHRSLIEARNDDDLRAVLDLLWDIALDVEDGNLSLAERALRDAQERLSEALENGASDEEIERLMKELRQAMAEYLRELSEQMAKNPPSQQMPFDQNMQTLSKRDLDRMMDQIENLAKSGSRDAARQLLSELQQMMDNLQAGRHQQQRRSESGDQFNQQMNQLGQMMQQQQRLMDETFRMQQQDPRNGQRQQGQRQQGQNRQGQQQQGQQGQMSPEEFAEAMKRLQQQQGDLRDQLQKFMEDMQNQGRNPGEQFGEAGEAMDGAKEALGQGENGEAVGEQGRALSAMRKGAQQMMQQMQQQMAGERGGTDANGQQRNDDNDPLGRRQQRRGPDLGQSVKVPDEIDAQRARQILETIRKRLSNPSRPRLELDYLDRLLRSR